MNENDLRDCFAMFAILKVTWKKGEEKADAEDCYTIADAMLEARKPKEEVGIKAVRKKKEL